MKRLSLTLLIVSLLSNNLFAMEASNDLIESVQSQQQVQETGSSNPEQKKRSAAELRLLREQSDAKYKAILKDMAIAYCLAMGLTIIHEFGHAIAAKLLYNDPINITIGSDGSDKKVTTLLKLGALQLVGLMPFEAFCSVPSLGESAEKDLYIALAGPAFAIVSSFLILLLLNKCSDKYYISKSIIVFAVFIDTIGGLLFGGPSSDLRRAVAILDKLQAKDF